VKVRIASRRETSGMRSPSQQRAQRLAYSFAHQIVANSESVQQKLVEEGVDACRISVIHNGLRLDRVAAPANGARGAVLQELLGSEIADLQNLPAHFVTIVANMRHEVKDYPMFLRAAQRVAKALPDVAFLMAGEGELQQSLERMAADFGIDDRTFFLGRCENIAQLLSVSDVCVLSSKAEGFSNSILEYMAAGRPVVATDVGGAREAIVEGETGYTVESGNDRAMASMIVSLLRDPARARSMGEQGRRVVEQNFSERVLLEKTEALYDQLLAKHVGTGSVATRAGAFGTGSVNVGERAGASPSSQP
jgi:glycosyltransferase involved in cell wall biosynthesis